MSHTERGDGRRRGRLDDRPLGVVLIDPETGALAQLSMLVSAQQDMEVLVHAEDADAALDAMRQLPHRLGVIVVLSMRLAGPHDAFWLIRAIREQYPTLPVMACGMELDETVISWALFTGVDGFVSLEVEPNQFVRALRRIGRREIILEGVPAGWLERGPDDERVPLVVLPDAADSERQELDGLMLTLPSDGTLPPPDGLALDDIAVASGSHRAGGLRLGRFLGRRRRAAGSAGPEPEPQPDTEAQSG